MGENLALFLRFYYRPSRAASEALDNGSVAFALALAVLTLVVWTFAGAGNLALAAPPHALGDQAVAFGLPQVANAALRLASPSSLFALFALFIGMTPVAIAIVAAWEGLGSASVVLRREYLSMVVCGLLSWSAAYLPLGLLQFGTRAVGLAIVGHLLFLGLFAVSLRTALGASTGRAMAATFGGWIAALAVVLLWPFIGGFSYFLLSPWLLYMAYRYYSPDVRSLGESMSSRRSFRRQMEAATINPRDADAHYQLGLIYEQRRQYEEAAASFQRAVSIRADEADAQLHLGRVLRALSKPLEALPHIQAALAADPRVSRNEGLRDLGATLLDLGRAQEACGVLERYTNTREYDPEGLMYYGSALRAMGRTNEARQAFEQAITAVETAPKYRRGQLRRWASEAKTQLRALKA